MTNRSITVEQHKNYNFKAAKPEHESTNPKLIYTVTKTVNTITVAIGDNLAPSKVNDLIRDGYTVTVNPEPKKPHVGLPCGKSLTELKRL